MIPYGRQSIDEEDIQAVVAALQSDWLTTGPKVPEFEQALARSTDSQYGVAVSSGTAALHAAMYAIGIGPGDEVIVPPLTFAASANCVVFQRGTPIFCDVEPDTLLIDPKQIEEKITKRTKAVIAVDYGGQPCDYDTIRAITDKHSLNLVADACHALGAYYKGRPVGSLADLSTFSFHPVKHITTAEGGMITTDDPHLAQKMRVFRNHGITSDHHQREVQVSWFYEMVDLGYNYRLTDIQCALGISQLGKLPTWIERRQAIARRYNEFFSQLPAVKPLAQRENVLNSYHLYVIKVDFTQLRTERAELFARLRHKGIGVSVHYVPVHLHPFYQRNFGTRLGMCPAAEAAYEQILSLPIYVGMTDADVETVCATLQNVLEP
jgi:perosamine synthetase